LVLSLNDDYSGMAAKLVSLLIGFGVVAAASGGLPCTTYPDAIFSPDGEWIYYVQSEMSGSFRTSSSTDGIPDGFGREHIDREVITVRRKHRESDRDELVRTIPAPPWVGKTYLATDCGEYRYASLSFNEYGELVFEFFGPSLRDHVDVQNSVISDELLAFHENDGTWTKTPFKSIYRRPQGDHAWMKLELVRYDDEWWWLLDHESHTYKVILAGSKSVRKNASNFTYEKILSLTQPRASR
jgi:hypothetical protein